MQQTVDQILAGGHLAGPATPIDHVRLWMAEQTVIGHTYAGILHANYQRWTEQHHIKALSVQEFGMGLKLLGVERQRDRRGSLLALAIKPNATRLQQTQADRRRQRAGLNRLFKR